MGRILENTKYKIILGVFSMLFASVMAFIWGTTRTFYAMIAIINSWGNDRKTLIAIIEVIDSILIAVALLIFAVSLYQLFIGKLNLPTWMPANNLHELKGKLGSLIIMVMSVKYLEHFVGWEDPNGTLYLGIALAVVAGALIAFSHFKKDN